jgi:hypothetical protein
MTAFRSRSWVAAGALAFPLVAAACVADAGDERAAAGASLVATAAAGPSTVAHGSWVISDFALDTTNAYVSIASNAAGAADTGEILAVKKDGSHAHALATKQSTPTSITVGAIHVYWLSDSMFEVLKSGGAPKLLATGVGGTSLQVHGDALYYVGAAQSSIFAVPTAGGAAKSIASGANLRSLALDKSHLYFTSCRTCAGFVFADTLATNQVASLADSRCCPWGVAVDSSEVYWSESTGGAIVKEALAGGTPTDVASVSGEAQGLTVDGSDVYWVQSTDGADGGIWKAPKTKTGGAPQQLAGGAWPFSRVAVDSSSVYFISADQKSLLKIAK